MYPGEPEGSRLNRWWPLGGMCLYLCVCVYVCVCHMTRGGSHMTRGGSYLQYRSSFQSSTLIGRAVTRSQTSLGDRARVRLGLGLGTMYFECMPY